MKHLLYLPKWQEILFKINNTPENKRYSQKLVRELKMSINHLRAILKRLEQENIIQIFPTKKIKWIVLTGRGKELSNAVSSIKTSMK